MTEPPQLPEERTALAWSRSAIGFAAIGALVIRFAAQRHEPWAYPVGGALLLVAAFAWRYSDPDFRGSRERGVRLLAAATFVTALLALAIALIAT